MARRAKQEDRRGTQATHSRPAFGVLAAAFVALLLLGGCGGGGGGGGGTPVAGTGNASTVYAGIPIPPGTECPFGGVKIEYGIDENGNGVLDPGEVDGYSTVCNGAGAQANPVTPPTGPAAQYTLDLSGGASASGYGVSGGSLSLSLSPSGGTGHIKLFNTGVADASFTFPATVHTHLGAVPLEVADDALLTVYGYDGTTHVGASADEFHTHLNDSSGTIYIRNAANDGDLPGTVTGIHVGAGATLDLALAYYGGSVYVTVANDIHNEGTITVGRTGSNGESSGYLLMFTAVYYGTAGSQILLRGTTDDAGTGGYGGGLHITAFSNQSGIFPYEGAIYNQGTIDVSGGDGTTGYGGSGNEVYLYGNLGVYNTGLIDASGGDSTGSSGGDGGYIRLDGYDYGTYFGKVFNAGILDVHGGNGETWGGSAGEVQLIARGDLLNSGDILSSGGDGKTNWGGRGDCGECTNLLEAYGGSVISSGDLLFNGGDNLSNTSGGGGGGWLSIGTYPDIIYLGVGSGNVPPGDIILSGNIDLSGGDGASGGDPNSLSLSIDATGLLAGQEIVLLGYQEIILDGGAGGQSGGSAGSLLARNDPSIVETVVIDIYSYDIYGPAGGIYNHVPVSARGGAGGSGYAAGNGGAFELLIPPEQGYQAPWQIAANYAAVDLSGGAGTDIGGNSGAVLIQGPSGAENHGNLTVNGGDGTNGSGGGPGLPGRTSGVRILSALGPAMNTATIHADGGSGEWSGGNGNQVLISGALAIHSGPLISVTGGAAANSGDGNGGDGGTVYLLSTQGQSTVTGDMDASGGEVAATPGHPGEGAAGVILIDGTNASGDYPLP